MQIKLRTIYLWTFCIALDNKQPFTRILYIQCVQCSVFVIGYMLCFIAIHITYCFHRRLSRVRNYVWVLNNVHKNDLAIIQQYYDINLWLSSWTPSLKIFHYLNFCTERQLHSWWFTTIYNSSFFCCERIINYNYDKPIGFGSKMFHKIIGRQ